jgi:hypothetical protein
VSANAKRRGWRTSEIRKITERRLTPIQIHCQSCSDKASGTCSLCHDGWSYPILAQALDDAHMGQPSHGSPLNATPMR